MSFKEIGTSFLTGFLTQKGKQMTAANEKAERYYDLQLQLAEQNKGKYKSRVAVANNLVSVANEIRSLHGTEEQIKAAVAQGPKELSNLLTRMKRDKDLKGTGWNKDYVQGVYAKLPANVTNSPEWLKYSEMDTTDYIMETLGVKKYEVGDYKSPDSSFWDKLSGKNKMARTRADLDELEFYEGMSVYDINQSANEADYNALLPGAFLEYTTDKYITSDVITTFRDDATKVEKAINQNNTYKNILEVAKNAFEIIPTGATFEQMVTSKSTNQAGKTIVNLSSLIKGDRITYEKHAVEGVTEEEFNKWADEDIEISKYIRDSNAYAQAQNRLEEMIRPDIEGLISVAEKDYGSNFTKDTEISRIIKKYVPSYQTGAVDDTTDADAGGAADADAGGVFKKKKKKAEVTATSVTADVSDALSNLNRTTPLSEDGSIWSFKNTEGNVYKIINANTDNPLIIREIDGTEVKGQKAKIFLNKLGLSNTLVLGKENQKKQLAKSLLETDIGKEFIERYKTPEGARFSRTANSTLLSVFKKMYGKNIPKEMESVLIKTIREAIK